MPHVVEKEPSPPPSTLIEESATHHGHNVASAATVSGYAVFGISTPVRKPKYWSKKDRQREKIIIGTPIKMGWLADRLEELERNAVRRPSHFEIVGREYVLREGDYELNWQLGVGWGDVHQEDFYRLNFSVEQLRDGVRNVREALRREGTA